MGFPPRELRDLQLRVRTEQQTPEWKARYAVRSGVEGTVNEFAHGHGMRRYRGQDKAHLQHVLIGDSAPTHILVGPSNRWSFYRNGQPITDISNLMVPEQADYQFVLDTKRDQNYPGVILGGKVHTEWNFTSVAPTTMAVKDCDKYSPKPTVCESMPAISIGYDVSLNVLNQAPAGQAFVFTVNGGRYKGWTGSTTMAGANVSVSYDDGATWQPTHVERKSDSSFQVVVKHPKLADTNGFVTLKTEVRDTAGNRTVQTITRAYALK